MRRLLLDLLDRLEVIQHRALDATRALQRLLRHEHPWGSWGFFARAADGSLERRRVDAHGELRMCRACRGWTRRPEPWCARCVREGRKPESYFDGVDFGEVEQRAAAAWVTATPEQREAALAQSREHLARVWPQADPLYGHGCPECGTLVGRQDGVNCHFCPACGWEGRLP